jgi:hypothetical protein
MMPPTAAPLKAPMPAPFSRVVRFPPAQPNKVASMNTAAKVVRVCFIVYLQE